jgi:hypothetical protein
MVTVGAASAVDTHKKTASPASALMQVIYQPPNRCDIKIEADLNKRKKGRRKTGGPSAFQTLRANA